MRAVALADTERATRLEAVGTVRAAYFRARAAKALIGVASQTLANQERHLVADHRVRAGGHAARRSISRRRAPTAPTRASA